MEDLGIDSRAADFEAEKGAQERANMMSQLSSAAGGSGIAG